MVHLCNSVAAASPHVTVEVVDAEAFPDIAARHRAAAVPLVVINGTTQVVDVVPAGELVAKIVAA